MILLRRLATRFNSICCVLIFSCFALLLLVLMPTAHPAGDEDTTRIIVVGDHAYAPFEFLNRDNEPAGITVDIWRLWSKKTGIPVDYRLMEWSTALDLVLKGKADAVGGIFHNYDRSKVFDYSRSFMKISTTIFFHKNISGISTIRDLHGFRVGIVHQDYAEDFLRTNFPGVEVVAFSSTRDMIQSAIKGEIRIFICDTPIGLYYLSKFDRLNIFRYTKKPIYRNKLYTAVRKGNFKRLDTIRKGFDKISTSEIEQIKQDWFGVATKTRFNWQRLVFSIAIGTFIALVIVLWNLQLRRRVAAATRDIEKNHHLLEISERTLRESESRYRTLTENTTDCIMRFDKSFRHLYVNPAVKHLTGIDQDKFIGKTHQEMGAPHHLTELWETTMEKVFSTGEVCHLEFEMPNNTWIDWLVIPERNVKGEIDTILTSARDITDRKMAEKEKEMLQEKLARSKKMEALGLLAGGVAHDLNNVLSGIVSYPDLLLMELPDESPLQKPILTMRDSGQKAATIVQDLLTLARRGVSVQDILNLNDIVTEYLASPEHQKLAHFHPEVNLETDFEKNLPNIKGSPVHLKKTVMNLVSNAAEAQPGGGTIRISTLSRYLDQPLKGYEKLKQGDYAVLRVEDTGEGIDKADVSRIFEPFYTKKKMGRSGTGLGMAVVWGTIKDHDGYIDLMSTKGEGTRFDLYLPIVREVVSRRTSGFSLGVFQGNRESILVVDDVADQLAIATDILKKLNYEVQTADSGEAAVAFLSHHTVDLVILDMIMAPGWDGLETYRKILERHPHQKAVIASGFAENHRVKAAQKLGAGTYVRKPYTLEKIAMAIKNELHEKR